MYLSNVHQKPSVEFDGSPVLAQKVPHPEAPRAPTTASAHVTHPPSLQLQAVTASHAQSLYPPWQQQAVPAASAQTSYPLPRFVVGIDFGTTFSGFTYSLVHDDIKEDVEVYKCFCYPGAERYRETYPKIPTAILYDDKKKPLCIGWQAFDRRAENPPVLSVFASSLFRLDLAPANMKRPPCVLPQGITAKQCRDDFLKILTDIAVFVLQKQTIELNPDQIVQQTQWCMTVPSIWSEQSKKAMEQCMLPFLSKGF
jgi:hypothetical protein